MGVDAFAGYYSIDAVVKSGIVKCLVIPQEEGVTLDEIEALQLPRQGPYSTLVELVDSQDWLTTAAPVDAGPTVSPEATVSRSVAEVDEPGQSMLRPDDDTVELREAVTRGIGGVGAAGAASFEGDWEGGGSKYARQTHFSCRRTLIIDAMTVLMQSGGAGAAGGAGVASFEGDWEGGGMLMNSGGSAPKKLDGDRTLE